METLDIGTIEQMQRLCEWLDSLPYKSAYSSDICRKHPDLAYWVSLDWLPERKYANAIFYQGGWGWRLRKDWRKRIDELLQADDVVLGSAGKLCSGTVLSGRPAHRTKQRYVQLSLDWQEDSSAE